MSALCCNKDVPKYIWTLFSWNQTKSVSTEKNIFGDTVEYGYKDHWI